MQHRPQVVAKVEEVVGIHKVSQLPNVHTVDQVTLYGQAGEATHALEGQRVLDGYSSV